MVGPVIATALVLMAVFIPIAFLPGITGQLYRQFALTIAVSVALSALNALTLTPALCALLLRPAGATRKRWLARTWNAAFLRLTNGYDRTVRRILRRSALAVVVLLLLTAAAYGLLRVVPTGFAPTEDQGYLLVNVQLPDAASVERTDAVVREIEKILLETPGVETVVAIGGRSFITGVNGPNVASLFPRLTPWSKRKTAELQAGAILGRLRARLSSIQEASIVVFPPPPIRGISSGGGFQFELQSVAGGSLQELDETARKIMDAARQRPELAATFTGFRPGVPQLDAQVDRAKAKALGIPLSDVFSSLQIFLGSLYVNDFNAFGRVYRVQLQAEPSFRASPSDVARLYVRSQPSASGPAQMVPLSTLVTVKPITGPDTISHYNLYRTAEIAGDTAPGASSGQAIAAMQEVARSVMPAGMSYEWTGLAYQELEAGSRAGFVFALSALFVFLVLAAQYESWLVPLAVLLAVPLGVLGALGALWLAGLANDVYAQIGLALLMGLASKNAILIVEFAKERREHGAEIQEAAREAARLRFRPILMTSFAFILGSLPLVFATGAGAASRNSMGTTVVGGMLAVTVIGVLLVPAFYVAVERLAESRRRPAKKGAEGVDLAPPPVDCLAEAPPRGGDDDQRPARRDDLERGPRQAAAVLPRPAGPAGRDPDSGLRGPRGAGRAGARAGHPQRGARPQPGSRAPHGGARQRRRRRRLEAARGRRGGVPRAPDGLWPAPDRDPEGSRGQSHPAPAAHRGMRPHLGVEVMTLFYGWVIVGVGIVITCVGFGAMATLSVFLQPMAEAMGWSRAGIALAAMVELPLHGPRRVHVGRALRPAGHAHGGAQRRRPARPRDGPGQPGGHAPAVPAPVRRDRRRGHRELLRAADLDHDPLVHPEPQPRGLSRRGGVERRLDGDGAALALADHAATTGAPRCGSSAIWCGW